MQGRKVKKWKRVEEQKKRVVEDKFQSAGEKRILMEFNEVGLEMMELEEMRVFKEVGIDVVVIK